MARFCLVLALLISSFTFASSPLTAPREREDLLDRWAERPNPVLPTITTDASLNWSKLQVKVWTQKTPSPFVLLLHGSWATFQDQNPNAWRNFDDMHALFYSMGFHVVELSRRGYEESEGERSEFAARRQSVSPDAYAQALLLDTAKDVRPVLRWIKQQPSFLPQGVLYGHSFGGVLAMHLADDPDASQIKSIINVAGGLGSFSKEEPSKQLVLSQKAFLENTHSTKPVLLVYSPKDTVIEYSLGQALATQAKKQNPRSKLISPKTLEGTDPHSAMVTGYNLDYWQQDLFRFLKENL